MPVNAEVKKDYVTISARVPETVRKNFRIALLKSGDEQEETIEKLLRYYAKNGLPE